MHEKMMKSVILSDCTAYTYASYNGSASHNRLGYGVRIEVCVVDLRSYI